MELWIYSRDMELAGILENQTSLIWKRRYNEVGEFEIHAPLTSQNASLLRIGNLVHKKAAAEAGVIEYIVINEAPGKAEIVCKGRFLESYMDRRITKATKTYSGKTEEIMHTLLFEDTEAIPRVEAGDIEGFTDEISFQVSYKGLLAYEQKLAKSAALGFRFVPDFTERTITFEVYNGEDRSESQSVNAHVVFSEMYENLNQATYTENDQTYKTKAFVGGKDENDDPVVVSVGGGTGLDLRECYVKADDIEKEDLSAEEFQAALEQRGYDELTKDALVQSFDGETEPDMNFRYKTDYDVGDIVTVKKESWGISIDLRVTEVEEIYETGSATIIPTFGTPLPDTIDWEDK